MFLHWVLFLFLICFHSHSVAGFRAPIHDFPSHPMVNMKHLSKICIWSAEWKTNLCLGSLPLRTVYISLKLLINLGSSRSLVNYSGSDLCFTEPCMLQWSGWEWREGELSWDSKWSWLNGSLLYPDSDSCPFRTKVPATVLRSVLSPWRCASSFTVEPGAFSPLGKVILKCSFLTEFLHYSYSENSRG